MSERVWVVTEDDLVLATFDNHAAAVDYCERDDDGGSRGTWADARHTYASRRWLYRIWNQTVWQAALPPASGRQG